MSVLPNDYDSDPGRFLSAGNLPHDDVHPYVAARFAAAGARLPVAGMCADAVAALYTLYHYDDPLEPIREARRVLRPGGLFAACAPNRDSDPELARAVPGWGAPSPFDGEDAESIVASVFSAPGDTVKAERWDGLRHPLIGS
jgi:SAM-dependent methyltransferase